MPGDATNPINIFAGMASGAMSGGASFASKIPWFLNFYRSLVVGLFLSVFLVVAIMLVFKVRPVIPQLSNSTDFDGFMNEDMLPDMVDCIRVFARDAGRFAPQVLKSTLNLAAVAPRPTSRFAPSFGSFAQVASVAQSAAGTLNALDDATLKRNARMYFDHYRCFCFRNDLPYVFFCGSALTHAPEFTVPGRGRLLNKDAVAQFEGAFVTPMEQLRCACQAISASAAAQVGSLTREAWYTGDPKAAFAWLTAAHKLRMYLNEYHEQVHESAMSRITDRWAINTWILYYVPYVADVIRHRIPELWAALPGRFVGYYNSWQGAWGRLGDVIINIPCNMAFTGEKRARYCNRTVFTVMNDGDFQAKGCGS